jgi:hypothetical protein
MGLDVNGTIVANPTAADIARAVESKRADDWYITIDDGKGGSLDAQAQPDGKFTLAHYVDDHNGERRRNAEPPLDATALKAVLTAFLAGEHGWDRTCRWQEPSRKRGPTRFVPAGKVTLRGEDGGPPPLAGGAVIVVIVAVGFVFAIEKLSPGAIRNNVPFGDSPYFWAGLIALPLIALVLAATASKVVEWRAAQSWAQTTGTIVRSEIAVERHRFAGEPETVKNVPAVEYEFNVGDRNIHGSRIGIGDDSGGANSEATLARYPLGTKVTVYYDPADPRRCVLERGGPQGLTASGVIALALELLVIGVAVWWLITRGPAFVGARFPHSEPGVVVFAAGVGIVVLWFFLAARRYSKQAFYWPAVRGKIVKSEVESYRDRVGGVNGTMLTFYRPVVEYVYQVRGRDYRANQIGVGITTEGSQSYAEAIAAKYPAGREVAVHYDPANPGVAALDNPTGTTWYLLLLVAACFALAIWQLGIF